MQAIHWFTVFSLALGCGPEPQTAIAPTRVASQIVCRDHEAKVVFDARTYVATYFVDETLVDRVNCGSTRRAGYDVVCFGSAFRFEYAIIGGPAKTARLVRTSAGNVTDVTMTCRETSPGAP